MKMLRNVTWFALAVAALLLIFARFHGELWNSAAAPAAQVESSKGSK